MSDLHANDQHFMTILDPGIKTTPGYAAYDRALAQDLFVKNVLGEPYLGWVWPGPCHFVDFLNPKAAPYWRQQLQDFHTDLAWDGIWVSFVGNVEGGWVRGW